MCPRLLLAHTWSLGAIELARANVANRPTRRAVKQAHAIAVNADEAAAASDLNLGTSPFKSKGRLEAENAALAATRRHLKDDFRLAPHGSVDVKGSSMLTLAVISVTNTMPVSGARTTPVKNAAMPTTANPSG